MANVVRTESQLFTLFADNIVGAITAQDGRDLVASVFGYPGTTAPSVSNDSVDTAGIGAFFDTGSVWVDTTHQEWYFCVIGTPGAAVWLARCCTTPTGAFVTNSGAAGVTPLSVQGVAGQTAPLQQWQVPAGTTLAEVLATGQFETFLTNLTAWIINQGSASQTVPFLEILNFLGSILWEISEFGESLSVGVGVLLSAISANVTIDRTVSLLEVDATTAARTVTLPAANAVPAGRLFGIKKIDPTTNHVTITRAGADLIDGATTVVLAKEYDFCVICSDGVANWLIWAANVATGAPGTGTVTSVAMTIPGVIFSLAGSPITSSGTLALTLLTQLANTVFAGPSSGAAATPTFRALALADLPLGTLQVFKFTLLYTQLTALGAVASGDIALQNPLPTYWYIKDAFIQILAADSFSGGAIMGVTAQLESGSGGTLIGSSVALKVATDTFTTAAQNLVGAFNTRGATGNSLWLRCTSSGANFNVLTQGKASIWVVGIYLGPPL